MHQPQTDTAIWATLLSAIWAAFLGLATYFIRKLQENSSVNKAIQAEVHRLKTVIKEHKDFWERCVKDSTANLHPLIPFTHVVYDEQVKNVGVIQRRLVEQVVRFYGYVDYINSFQELRGQYKTVKQIKMFNKMYLSTLERLVRDF
jgi:hypothetical protein